MRLSPLVLAAALIPVRALANVDVGIALDDAVTQALHGQTLDYTLTVANTGTDAATSAHIAVALSAEATLTTAACTDTTASAPCSGTFDSTALTLDGDIPAGETITITFSATVASNASSVITSATSSGAYTDSNSANDAAQDSDEVLSQADLGITASGPSSVNERSAYAYTINVANNGPEAPAFVVTAQLSGGATFSGADGGIFTCNLVDSTHLQCSGAPPVDPEGASTVTANVVAPVGDATVSMTTTYLDNHIDDPTTTNNSATVTTTVVAVNDRPVVTAPISITTPFNGTATFSSDNAITVTDSDAGSDGIQIRLQTEHGTFSLGGIDALTFTNGTGTDDTTAVFSGSQTDITTAFAGAVFTPVHNFHATATLTIIADDLGHNGPGGAQEGQATVSILAGESDSDHDGLSDDDEITFGTDPNDDDTDDDGIIDGNEDANRNLQVDADETNPANADTDADGLLDGLEISLAAPQGHDTSSGIFAADHDTSTHTDPLNPDTDGGGKLDGLEDTNHNGVVDAGETDPNNPSDDAAEQPPPDGGDTGDESTPTTPSSPTLTAGGSGCAAVGVSPLMLLGVVGLMRWRRRLDQ